jgi:NADH-quinone oxidoreductase subunit E
MMTQSKPGLSARAKAEIDEWLKKYPADQRRSAVIPALHIAQDENGGWLTTELMNEVGDYLQIPHVAVYEVATFYSMYELKPVGRHKISVCTNISCMLADSDGIVRCLKDRLGIEFNETTPDGKFTLKEVECLGACVTAPVMLVDKTYHEKLTPEKVDHILSELE